MKVIIVVLVLALAVASANKCEAAGGKCWDTNKFECSQTFKTGLCPGSAAIRCCTGTAYPVSGSVTAPVTNTPVTGASKVRVVRNRARNMPPWAALAKCFPQGTPAEVKARIGGNVNADWITNTCAIRMSDTLNCAAKSGHSLHRIPKDLGGDQVTDKNKARIYFRVKALRPHMIRTYGLPTVQVSNKDGSLGIPIDEFKGKKGIIQFEIKWADATGHFDLWDGNAMLEYNHSSPDKTAEYFGKAKSVSLWETN